LEERAMLVSLASPRRIAGWILGAAVAAGACGGSSGSPGDDPENDAATAPHGQGPHVDSGSPIAEAGKDLFYDTTCDASSGTDNLNDTGGTIPSGTWTFWFIHHPGLTDSSAIWSIGSIKSPCIDYSTAPDC
jgi:hypothetical protein